MGRTMVLHATEQTAVDIKGSPHTRAVPAFKVVVKAATATATEDTQPGNFFPSGIDFESVAPIAATVEQSLDDHAAVLELLSDDE